MTSGFETVFLTNTLQIFGGSLLFVSLIFVAVAFAVMMYMRTPVIIMIPSIAIALMIVGVAFDPYKIVLGLGLAIMIAYFIYALWSGRGGG